MSLTGIQIGGRLLGLALSLGALTGATVFVHKTGHTHERKIVAKSTAAAAERKEEGVGEIEDIQSKEDPIIRYEKDTIIKTDRQSAIELGRVKGELEALRLRYENISSGNWGDGDLPSVVRDEISEIDNLLSRL